jgi:hypothetical protein
MGCGPSAYFGGSPAICKLKVWSFQTPTRSAAAAEEAEPRAGDCSHTEQQHPKTLMMKPIPAPVLGIAVSPPCHLGGSARPPVIWEMVRERPLVFPNEREAKAVELRCCFGGNVGAEPKRWEAPESGNDGERKTADECPSRHNIVRPPGKMSGPTIVLVL